MTPLAARAAGILRSPRITIAQICSQVNPPWVDVLVLSTLVMFTSSAAFLATDVGQTALLDQLERTAIAFGQTVDDGVYSNLQAVSTRGLLYSGGMSLAGGPLITAVLTGVIVGMLRVRGQQVDGRKVLSVVSHASVVLALRQVIALPVNYISESLSSPATLVMFMSGFDEASPIARFLGAIDLFVVWWIVVLAIGVSALAQRRIRSLALAFAGIYVAVALLLALAMAAAGGTA